MKLIRSLAVLSLLGGVALSSAFAADAAASAAAGKGDLGACMEDVHKLCPSAKPGDGSVKACLKENRRKLSSACKTEIKERRAAR
jgi:Mrp family chromosome partitioning ATPase